MMCQLFEYSLVIAGDFFLIVTPRVGTCISYRQPNIHTVDVQFSTVVTNRLTTGGAQTSSLFIQKEALVVGWQYDSTRIVEACLF
jgi:hypothetical protein